MESQTVEIRNLGVAQSTGYARAFDERKWTKVGCLKKKKRDDGGRKDGREKTIQLRRKPWTPTSLRRTRRTGELKKGSRGEPKEKETSEESRFALKGLREKPLRTSFKEKRMGD